jgi:hypothetical protein
MFRVMKYLFLIGAQPHRATPSMAQCGCGKLWLAMDDNRQYQYSYRVAKEGDTTEVTKVRLLGVATSIAPFSQKSVADRPHVVVHLPAYQTTNILVDVTDMVNHQKMQLTLKSRGLDRTYQLLVDFAPGSHYQLVLDDLRYKPVGESEGLSSEFGVRPMEEGEDGTYWLKLYRK